MISIIICSRNNDIPASLKKNIDETIGCEYELVVIDNSSNIFSIFSAYNEGVQRSKGDVLCFMHEDVLFHEMGWGVKVLQHFENEKIGLVGVLGGHYLPKKVCHIGDSGLLSANYFYSIGEKRELVRFGNSWNNSGESEVVAVDGLWFCMRKELFNTVSFDSKTYSGFHYYDMDISMQVWQAGYTCVVVDDVLLEHRSGGVINKNFIYSAYDFYKKWEKKLPMKKGIEISEREKVLATELCEYKRYCREVQCDLDMVRNNKFDRWLKRIKKLF